MLCINFGNLLWPIQPLSFLYWVLTVRIEQILFKKYKVFKIYCFKNKYQPAFISWCYKCALWFTTFSLVKHVYLLHIMSIKVRSLYEHLKKMEWFIIKFVFGQNLTALMFCATYYNFKIRSLYLVWKVDILLSTCINCHSRKFKLTSCVHRRL